MATTTYATKASEISHNWHFIDAQGEILGRLATKITPLLIGKGKANYAPYLDMGDHVVIVNAGNVRVTGRKEAEKLYYQYSSRPGHTKIRTYRQMKERRPLDIVKVAIKRMLPPNRLRTVRMARLHVYLGKEHPYADKFAEKV